jgi:hypothetical protein
MPIEHACSAYVRVDKRRFGDELIGRMQIRLRSDCRAVKRGSSGTSKQAKKCWSIRRAAEVAKMMNSESY